MSKRNHIYTNLRGLTVEQIAFMYEGGEIGRENAYSVLKRYHNLATNQIHAILDNKEVYSNAQ